MSQIPQNESVFLERQQKVFQTKVQAMVERIQRPYASLLMQGFKCNEEWFSQDRYSLQEAYHCAEQCQVPLEQARNKQETEFARMDAGLNNCLHSCTKQRRKGSALTGDAIHCYTDCFEQTEKLLADIEQALSLGYSKFLQYQFHQKIWGFESVRRDNFKMEFEYGAPQKRTYQHGKAPTLNDVKRKRLISGVYGIKPTFETMQPVLQKTPNFEFASPQSRQNKNRNSERYKQILSWPDFKPCLTPKTTTFKPFSFSNRDTFASPANLTRAQSPTAMPFSPRQWTSPTFKAQRMPSFQNPFQPMLSPKALTVPREPQLATARRSMERDVLRSENSRGLVEENMYKPTTHFPTSPINFSGPLCIKSSKPLTIPQEPNLHTQQRAEIRQMLKSQEWTYKDDNHSSADNFLDEFAETGTTSMNYSFFGDEDIDMLLE